MGGPKGLTPKASLRCMTEAEPGAAGGVAPIPVAHELRWLMSDTTVKKVSSRKSPHGEMDQTYLVAEEEGFIAPMAERETAEEG